MTHGHDSQRGKLYKAERACGLFQMKKFASFEEAVKFGERVIKSKHWQKRYPYAGVPQWRKNHKLGGSHASAWNGVTLGTFDAGTVLHELAHVATSYTGPSWGEREAGEGWHGRAFVRAYLGLVRRFMGREAHDKLKASIKECGVKYVRKPKVGINLGFVQRPMEEVVA